MKFTHECVQCGKIYAVKHDGKHYRCSKCREVKESAEEAYLEAVDKVLKEYGGMHPDGLVKHGCSRLLFEAMEKGCEQHDILRKVDRLILYHLAEQEELQKGGY